MSEVSAVGRARSVPALLEALQDSNPGRPRLTWYGPGGERIELSAKTLANWVAKTANLLADELDVQPGARVAMAIAPHWKTVVIDLAARAVGAEPTGHPDPAAELVVTDDPARPGVSDATTLVVALAALARRYPGDLGGGVDYAAEVFAQDDVFRPVAPRPLPSTPPATAPGSRLLVRTDQPDAVPRVLDALRADGSVVLAVPETGADALAGEHLD